MSTENKQASEDKAREYFTECEVEMAKAVKASLLKLAELVSTDANELSGEQIDSEANKLVQTIRAAHCKSLVAMENMCHVVEQQLPKEDDNRPPMEIVISFLCEEDGWTEKELVEQFKEDEYEPQTIQEMADAIRQLRPLRTKLKNLNDAIEEVEEVIDEHAPSAGCRMPDRFGQRRARELRRERGERISKLYET